MKGQLPQNAPEVEHNAPPGAGSTEGGANPPAPKRGRRLRTLGHVRAGLAALIRDLEAGRIDPNKGNALTNAYRTLAAVLGADVTAEIAEIRESLETVGHDA